MRFNCIFIYNPYYCNTISVFGLNEKGISWTLDSGDGTLWISGSGEMRNYSFDLNYNKPPWYEKRNEIIRVVIYDSISSIGNNAFYDCYNLKSVSIPDSVTLIGDYAFYNCYSLTSITIPNSVTSISDHAFSYCSSLTSITIPNSVTSIGDYAFFDCSSLTSITIPNSVTSIGEETFYDCSKLTSITIPDSVTSIGSGAFSNCSSLTSIIIPDSITSIKSYAFSYCNKLKSLTLPISASIESNSFTNVANLESVTLTPGTGVGADYTSTTYKYTPWYISRNSLTNLNLSQGITLIGDYAFYACSNLTSITIPDSVTSIGGGAFGGCSGLTSITIPDSVTSIGEETFYDCSKLTSITIPDSVTSIGEQAFWSCQSLTSITIPNSVTSIGDYAFYCCSNLTSITIPDSVTSIGGGAFDGCSGLTSITIPDSVTSIGASAFYACSNLTSITIPNSVTSIGVWAFSHCSSLTSITIPNSVTSIGGGAFGGCSGLTSITIPDSVTSIGGGTFDGCSGLTSITIPDSVTSIGASAFFDCSNLTSITIPDSVTSIGYYAFWNCSGLTSITIPDSVTSIGERAFYDCSNLTANIGNSYYVENYCKNNNINYVKGTFNEYTIVFNSKGGSPVSSITQIYGTDIVAPDNPTREGYTFDGWNPTLPSTMPNSNMTLNAKWNIIEYVITYNLGGGTNSNNNPSLYTVETNTITLSKPTRDRFVFVEWKEGDSVITSIPKGTTGNKTLTAVWKDPSGTFDDLNWTYSEDNNRLIISGTGDMLSKTNANQYPWYQFKDYIESIVIDNGVTSIGRDAFAEYEVLSSVTIPNSVTTIERGVFYGCVSLNSISLPDSILSIGSWCFANNPSLKSVNIPNGVTLLDEGLFNNCTSLETITIPSSVTSIYPSIFSGCSNLKMINVDSNSEKYVSIDGVLFTKVNNMPTKLHSYPSGKGSSYMIPDSTTYIENGAFRGCSNLESVTIPNTVTSIDNYAFYDCSNLKSITMPISTTMTSSSFTNVTNLQSIVLTAENGKCVNYTTTSYKYTPWYKSKDNFTTATLENGITKIGNYTFYNCSKLSTLNVPNTVSSIGSGALSNCSNLTVYIINNNYVENYCISNNINYFKNESNNQLTIPNNIANTNNKLFINGNPVTISNGIVEIEDDSKVASIYDVANANNEDIHTKYPKSMKVYLIEEDNSGNKQLVHHPNFDNILTYAGASIRITGKKGIRIITSIPTAKKNQLINQGIDGYKVMEYGTLMSWASSLPEGKEPTVDLVGKGVVKGRAYSREANMNSVYSEGNGVTKYTNTLVGDYTDAQCSSDFAMRSYMIIRPNDATDSSQDIVLYGGTLYRSISYVALQNKNAFPKGSAGYEYIWKLIKAGYPSIYNSEYGG